MSLAALDSSKHAHFQAKNPLTRRVFAHFFHTLEDAVRPLQARSILDAGCGEGLVLKMLEPYLGTVRCRAFDANPAEVADAQKNIPFAQPDVGDIYHIPFADKSFELVLCTEVLEHLEDPEAALRELRRVASRYAVLSVPHEPWWRILNLLRGQYWSTWGNTPDHRNHWTPRAFAAFARRQFPKVRRCRAFPWTILVCETGAGHEER